MTTQDTLDLSISLDTDDARLLERSARLLVWIQPPSLLMRARKVGFTPAEQREGWSLYRLAAGAETTTADNLVSASLAPHDADIQAERDAQLTALDEFENTWLPRTRTIIRRAVAKERRDAFLAAFFDELEMQPKGPGVIGSTDKYLRRVVALESAPDNDSKRVRKTLRERGLDDALVASIRALIDAATDVGKTPSPPDEDAVATVKATREARLGALDDLRDWYQDWATTFRTVFSTREQIRLGLTSPKKRRKKEQGATAPK